MDDMMKITKSPLHFFKGDVLDGEGVVKGEKRYKDAAAFYESRQADLCGDTLMYEVYAKEEAAVHGELNWGLTVLYPLTVCGECNMTRGHWHKDRSCAEYYYGISGHGLLLLMDEEGNTWAQEVYEGSLHHISGHLAHRLINTGDDILKVAACWGSDAGHDYAAVEKLPFGYRVYKGKNGVFVKKVKGETKE